MTLIDLIERQNPWFSDAFARPREKNWPKRELFSSLFSFVSKTKQITALKGLRRTGKSTLLKQIIAQLLDNKTPAKHIFYFAFDQPTVAENKETLEAVISLFEKEILYEKITEVSCPVYIFLDEIQLIAYWQDILKKYYDISQKIKFVVSGSSSLFIGPQSHESLAGRMFDCVLGPLSFREFCDFSKGQDFAAFLKFGQFPELLELPDQEKKLAYLRETIVGRVLEVDIPRSASIRHSSDLEGLFWSLLPNTGQIIESRQLLTDLGMKKATLFKYLSVLEQSLLIQKVENLSGSFRSSSRLLRKLYPASVNFLNLTADSINTGFRVEAYVQSFLAKKFKNVYLYHQRGKEIDFLLPEQKIAVEVKYKENIHPKELDFLLSFAAEKKYQPMIITKHPAPQLTNLVVVPATLIEQHFEKTDIELD